MRENSRLENYPDDSPVRAKLLEFNVRYCHMLRTLHCTLNGEATKLDSVVSQIKESRYRARELMLMPTGDGSPPQARHLSTWRLQGRTALNGRASDQRTQGWRTRR